MKSFLLPLSLVLASASLSFGGDDDRGDTPGSTPSTPEEERKMFHLPPGFEIDLVAAEPEIQKPINLNFDAMGRIWVTGSELYPWPAAKDALGEPIEGFAKVYQNIINDYAKGGKAPDASPEGKDTVRVLSNFDATGHAQKVDIFADGLSIPSGVQPLPRAPGAKGDTVIVYSVPYIWRMEDTTGSGKADKRERLFGPFGFLDTHGGSSSFVQWVDGWIYGTHGFRNHSEVKWLKSPGGETTVLESGNTYRFKPDGSAFEYYTHGQTNPFGLAFDPLGNLFSADSHSKPVYMLLKGGYYEGIGKQDDGLGFAPRITEDPHGSTAIGGIACYANDAWPEEYRGNLFNGNVVTRKVNRDRLEWHGSTPKAIRQPDFLTSDDPWFRPVQVKLGPDGAFYIADFYNPIIGHYEVPLTDPHRDHSHGRIWRITYKGGDAKTPPLPNLVAGDAPALVDAMGSSNLEVRRLATNELAGRVTDETKPLLQKAIDEAKGLPAGTRVMPDAFGAKSEASDPQALHKELEGAHAMWVLSRQKDFDPQPEKDLLVGEHDPFLALHAMKILSEKANAPSAILERPTEWTNPLLERTTLEFFDWLHSEYRGEQEIKPLKSLLEMWRVAPATDPELVYTVRMATRNLLQRDFLAPQLVDRFSEEEQNRIAEIALAIPSPGAAAYTAEFLHRRKYHTARLGDLVQQVVLHVEPAQKAEELVTGAGEIADLSADDRLAVANGLNEGARRRGTKLSPAAETWIAQSLVAALDTPARDRALAALRDLKTESKLEPLRKVAEDESLPGDRRVAALEALFDCQGGPAVATKELGDPVSLPVRKRAAELLGQRAGAADGGSEEREALRKALATAPWELATSIGGALAKSDHGAETLLAAVEEGKAPPALLRHNAVSGPLAGRSPALRDRATALTKNLPPEDARLDGVIAARATAYRQALAGPADGKPNAEHGAQVFQQNCAVCHKIKTQGGNIGPSLDGVGVRGVERLMEDILDPNRNVDPAFRQVFVETTDGQTLAGVRPHPAGELLVLNDALGKEVTVPLAQVKSQTTSLISLMPPTFEQALSVKDLTDLAAFLLAQTSS